MSEALARTYENELSPQPFLKWVGGKRQLISELLARLPKKFSRYHEPFLGGGALFFALLPEAASLSDLNPQLIETYCVVRDHTDELISSLSKHIYDKEYFYKIRSLDRESEFQELSPIERASRFIYLNKTCFNGLYRVNQEGFFNVPFGKYTNPRIVDPDNMRACASVLKNSKLSCASFEDLLESAQPDDFVYFDPPYAPISNTAHFTSYQEGGFSFEKQRELKRVCDELTLRGVKWMVSNSSSPFIKELYSQYAIDTVSAVRAINSVGAKRGAIEEVIIRNYVI